MFFPVAPPPLIRIKKCKQAVNEQQIKENEKKKNVKRIKCIGKQDCKKINEPYVECRLANGHISLSHN